MFNTYSLWKNIFLLFFSSIYLTKVLSNQRINLAQRHPCYSINKRLEPYIKWTEKLASTQHRVQKDACGQISTNGPACCTNEIFTSYASSLGTDLKLLFDTELDQLKQLLELSNKQIDNWTKEYLHESHHITIATLEILFRTKEYHSNIHHSVINLFDILGNEKSTDDDVSKSVVNLLNHLIISTYRRFMTNNSDLILDEQFKKCLINTASSMDAFPTQRELLYTITSAASLIRILRTLFIYIDADIQRLKASVSLNSNQCIQRYVRETLCPICVSMPLSFSSSIHYDNNINEPLCENDCHYVIKNCFNQTSNPYIDFALTAQGYLNITQQIQEYVVELKLVERLSKLHIYLYDMVINVTNTRETYTALQSACPNENEKVFTPIISLSPATNERREFVTQWNISLHSMLDKLQSSIDKLNTSLTQHIINDICMNSNYAVKSNRCTQIDQNTPADFSQWPTSSFEPNSPIIPNFIDESTKDQIEDLKRKMDPIERIVLSMRPKKKPSFWDYLPDLEYDSEMDTIDDYDSSFLPTTTELYENENEEPLSDQLFKQFDGKPIVQPITTTTTMMMTSAVFPEEKNVNHSQSITYSITSYVIVFVGLILYRISFTNK